MGKRKKGRHKKRVKRKTYSIERGVIKKIPETQEKPYSSLSDPLEEPDAQEDVGTNSIKEISKSESLDIYLIKVKKDSKGIYYSLMDVSDDIFYDETMPNTVQLDVTYVHDSKWLNFFSKTDLAYYYKGEEVFSSSQINPESISKLESAIKENYIDNRGEIIKKYVEVKAIRNHIKV